MSPIPVAAARLWNSLSLHVTAAPSLSIFCCRLKSHLFSFLPRDASAERGDATVSCPSVTFRYRVQIGLNSSKIISWPNSLRPLLWLTPNMGDLVQREHPQNWG